MYHGEHLYALSQSALLRRRRNRRLKFAATQLGPTIGIRKTNQAVTPCRPPARMSSSRPRLSTKNLGTQFQAQFKNAAQPQGHRGPIARIQRPRSRTRLLPSTVAAQLLEPTGLVHERGTIPRTWRASSRNIAAQLQEPNAPTPKTWWPSPRTRPSSKNLEAQFQKLGGAVEERDPA